MQEVISAVLSILQSFLTMTDGQRIPAGAQSLHLTQPTLSRQVDNERESHRWLKKESTELHAVATCNLICNATLMADEEMGHVFTLNELVHTTGSNLCFRPLCPGLELGIVRFGRNPRSSPEPWSCFWNSFRSSWLLFERVE